MQTEPVIDLTSAEIIPHATEDIADHWLSRYSKALQTIEAMRLEMALKDQALYVYEQNSDELSKTFEVLEKAGLTVKPCSVARIVAELVSDVEVLRSGLAGE